MKNKIILFCLLVSIEAHAQNEFAVYCSDTRECINKKQYYRAITILQSVKRDYAKTKSQQDTIDLYMTNCTVGIYQLLVTAILEKAKNDSLLVIANSMQRSFETIIFDKAVNERIKEWNGYENYLNLNSEDKNALQKKIDTLNLSTCSLSRIPHEIKDFPPR